MGDRSGDRIAQGSEQHEPAHRGDRREHGHPEQRAGELPHSPPPDGGPGSPDGAPGSPGSPGSPGRIGGSAAAMPGAVPMITSARIRTSPSIMGKAVLVR